MMPTAGFGQHHSVRHHDKTRPYKRLQDRGGKRGLAALCLVGGGDGVIGV